MSVFLITLFLSISTLNNVFQNRVFPFGKNDNGKLFGDPTLYESYPRNTNHRITDFSEEIETIDLCGVQNTYFFLKSNGEVIGTGDGRFFGEEFTDESIFVPQKLNFSSPHFSASKIYCGSEFAIFCSSSFDQCFGLGDNTLCDFAGCYNESNKIFISSPISIYSDQLISLMLMNTSFLQEEEKRSIKKKQIFVGEMNTLILLKNESNNENLLFGTGANAKGVLSIGSTSASQDWVQMDLSSSSLLFSSIQHLSFFGFSLYIVTEDNRWFFGGYEKDSTCGGFFSYTVSFLTELPQPSTFDCSPNEILGKNIIDLKCSNMHCVSLTNESKVYSWGKISILSYYGRIYTSNEYLYPMKVNMTLLEKETMQDNDTIQRIEEIFIQKTFTFAILMDYTNNKKRIFGFGGDTSSSYEFEETSNEFMFEVFKEQDLTLTPFLTLSNGNFQSNSIFLRDTSICWGQNSNDSSNLCNPHGYCDDFNTCQCEDEYFGTYCNLTSCFDIASNDSQQVCNGNGDCIAHDVCECFLQQSEGGVSEDCTYSICFGVGMFDSDVCSSHGKCIAPDTCFCDEDYEGDQCEKGPISLGLILGISISSFLVISSIIFIISLCFICCFCCLAFSVLLIFVFYYLKHKKKMKTFKSIKNIDLIMEEQKLEERVDIAHLRINKQLFQIQMNEIKLKKILGEGGSNSVVYLVLWHGKDAAFKCFKTKSVCSEQREFDEFEKEVEILGSISHPNIIRYYGACLDPSRTGFVMEYCPNGDLNHFIALKRSKQEVFELSEKIRMLTEIAFAMSFLHSKKIIHRDLKPENVLLDSSLTCKLMDFGASKFYEQTKMNANMTKGIGTSYFMSPEIVLGSHYTNKVDIFSFGVLMFVLLTEQLNPYSNRSDCFNVEFKVANDPTFRPKFVDQQENDDALAIPSHLKEICQKCWNHQAEERPSFKEIILQFQRKMNTETSSTAINLFSEEEKASERSVKEKISLLKSQNEGLKKRGKVNEREVENLKKEIELTKKKIAFFKKENEHIQKELLKEKENKEI